MVCHNDSLCLHEEVMLIALRDREGTLAAPSTFPYALGGAIVAELLLAERIALDERRRPARSGFTQWLKGACTENHLVNVMSDGPMANDLLNECLQRMTRSGRRESLKRWVQRFAGLSDLHHRVATGLCDRGILWADENTVMAIFKRKVYPELDPQPEQQLINRLRAAIFTDAREVSPRTSILLALADSADLLRIPFEKHALKQRRDRIAEITSGQLLGNATKEAIEAAQAAVATAAIVPCMVAATVCTS